MFIFTLFFVSGILFSFGNTYAAAGKKHHPLDAIVNHFGAFNIDSVDEATLKSINSAPQEKLCSYAQDLQNRPDCAGLIKEFHQRYTLTFQEPAKWWGNYTRELSYERGTHVSLAKLAINDPSACTPYYTCNPRQASCKPANNFSSTSYSIVDTHNAEPIFFALQKLYQAEQAWRNKESKI